MQTTWQLVQVFHVWGAHKLSEHVGMSLLEGQLELLSMAMVQLQGVACATTCGACDVVCSGSQLQSF